MSEQFGCNMPLTRGTALAYDATAMALGFTMTDRRGRTIQCSISGAAMDELDSSNKGKGTLPKDRRAQFERLRERIEEMASAMFDHDKSGRDTVQIYYHHAWSRKYRAVLPAAASAATQAIAESPGETVLQGSSRKTGPGDPA